jgi:hypothetical protein
MGSKRVSFIMLFSLKWGKLILLQTRQEGIMVQRLPSKFFLCWLHGSNLAQGPYGWGLPWMVGWLPKSAVDKAKRQAAGSIRCGRRPGRSDE